MSRHPQHLQFLKCGLQSNYHCILQISKLELLRKFVCYVPTLRFAGYTKEWRQESLSNFAKKITAKNTNNAINNVICNSAQNGLIPQLEFFDKEIANNEIKWAPSPITEIWPSKHEKTRKYTLKSKIEKI